MNDFRDEKVRHKGNSKRTCGCGELRAHRKGTLREKCDHKLKRRCCFPQWVGGPCKLYKSPLRDGFVWACYLKSWRYLCAECTWFITKASCCCEFHLHCIIVDINIIVSWLRTTLLSSVHRKCSKRWNHEWAGIVNDVCEKHVAIAVTVLLSSCSSTSMTTLSTYGKSHNILDKSTPQSVNSCIEDRRMWRYQQCTSQKKQTIHLCDQLRFSKGLIMEMHTSEGYTDLFSRSTIVYIIRTQASIKWKSHKREP